MHFEAYLMKIPEISKFFVRRFLVTTILVSIPFLLFLAQSSRLIVQNESEYYRETARDVQLRSNDTARNIRRRDTNRVRSRILRPGKLSSR